MDVIDSTAWLRCWCCGAPPMVDGRCAVCDLSGLVSPPHLCVARGILMTDEHGCEPAFAPLAADHETLRFGPSPPE